MQFLKIRHHTSGHEFEARWGSVGQDLSNVENIPLSMNFILGFNGDKMGQNLVQALRTFQTDADDRAKDFSSD